MKGFGVADSLVAGPVKLRVTLCHFLSSPETMAGPLVAGRTETAASSLAVLPELSVTVRRKM